MDEEHHKSFQRSFKVAEEKIPGQPQLRGNPQSTNSPSQKNVEEFLPSAFDSRIDKILVPDNIISKALYDCKDRKYSQPRTKMSISKFSPHDFHP